MSELKYACTGCGKVLMKAEGGTILTLCDDCWDKHYAIRKDHNCDAMGCSSVRHYFAADVAQPEEQPICCGKVKNQPPDLTAGEFNRSE